MSQFFFRGAPGAVPRRYLGIVPVLIGFLALALLSDFGEEEGSVLIELFLPAGAEEPFSENHIPTVEAGESLRSLASQGNLFCVVFSLATSAGSKRLGQLYGLEDPFPEAGLAHLKRGLVAVNGVLLGSRDTLAEAVAREGRIRSPRRSAVRDTRWSRAGELVIDVEAPPNVSVALLLLEPSSSGGTERAAPSLPWRHAGAVMEPIGVQMNAEGPLASHAPTDEGTGPRDVREEIPQWFTFSVTQAAAEQDALLLFSSEGTVVDVHPVAIP